MSGAAERVIDGELGDILLEANALAHEQAEAEIVDMRDWDRPSRWCRRRGARLWTAQQTIIDAVADHERVAIPGGHGLGKGHITAWLARWWMARPNSRCLITANTNNQVRKNTWHEMRVCHSRYGWPGVCGIQPQWSFPGDPTREVLGMTTDNPDAFQGKHAPHFMLIVDEAAGDRLDKLWTVLMTLVTEEGGKVVFIGNRTRRVGVFARACKGEFGFHVIPVSSTEAADYQLEHGPVPGLTDWPTITKWARDYGGYSGQSHASLLRWIKTVGIKNDDFRPRALGLPPLGEGGGMFSAALLDAATQRHVAGEGALVIAIDVARLGGDESVAAIRRGKKIVFGPSWRCDHAKLLLEVDEWLRTLQHEHDVNAGPPIKVVRVDATGEGSALPDLLAARGWPVERVHFGGRAKRPDKFKNRRAEGYRTLQTEMRDGADIPDHDLLIEELEHIEPIPGGVSGVGGATVEALPPKKEIKKLLGRSPDHADAVVMTVMPAVEAEARVEVW